MPECHKCRHNQDPALKGLPWEQTPCSKCSLPPDPTHHGRTHVSRDSSDAVVDEEAMQQEAVMDTRYDKLAGFLRQFMSLPACTRDVVALRFCDPDKPLSSIADRHGITVQAVHSRLKKALDRFPVLREVITIRKREGSESED